MSLDFLNNAKGVIVSWYVVDQKKGRYSFHKLKENNLLYGLALSIFGSLSDLSSLSILFGIVSRELHFIITANVVFHELVLIIEK